MRASSEPELHAWNTSGAQIRLILISHLTGEGRTQSLRLIPRNRPVIYRDDSRSLEYQLTRSVGIREGVGEASLSPLRYKRKSLVSLVEWYFSRFSRRRTSFDSHRLKRRRHFTRALLTCKSQLPTQQNPLILKTQCPPIKKKHSEKTPSGNKEYLFITGWGV